MMARIPEATLLLFFFFGNSSAWCVCMADYRAHIQVLGVVTFEMSKFLIKNV